MILRSLPGISASISSAVKSLTDPQPRFEIKLGWTKSYEQLFGGEFSETSAISEVLKRVKQSGRVLLTGRGGGAKTVIVHRIAKEALRLNIVPLVLSLKNWTAQDYDLWRTRAESSSRLDFLLQRFGFATVSVADLDGFSPDVQRLILLDGLNEVDSRTGQEIIYILDEFVRYAVNTSVVVTDRLVRREFIRPPRWQLGMVLPLEESEVRRHVGSTYESFSEDTKLLLQTPYFLSSYLSDGYVADSRSGEMKEYFVSYALTEPELDVAASAAFEVYGDSARSFDTGRFEALVGSGTFRKLVQTGAVIQRGVLSYFDHHLKHDYLAARHLVGGVDRWTSETLDRITFNASSFETIMFAVEQIGNRAQADLFVRRVYDWNIYGVGYALSEARQSAVSPEMQNVILAMFAERKWDVIEATAKRAIDTLGLIPSDDAKRYLAANNIEAVFRLIEEVRSNEQWFQEWKGLFTMRAIDGRFEAPIELLRNPDSVLGWTASNVLKRMQLSPQIQQELVALLLHNSDVIRWRVTHVLGSFPSDANLDALAERLTDIPRVRYGAVRSLIEMAAYSERELAMRIFVRLRERANEITQHRGVVDEFLRAIFVTRKQIADFDWLQSVFQVINVLQEHSPEESRAQYERVSQRLVETYGRSQ